MELSFTILEKDLSLLDAAKEVYNELQSKKSKYRLDKQCRLWRFWSLCGNELG